MQPQPYILITLLVLAPWQAYACSYSNSPNRIDIIGDSHTTQAFGVELENSLEANTDIGAGNVFRFAVAGSTAGEWAAATNASLRSLTIRSFCPGDGDIQGAAPSPQFPTATVLAAQVPAPRAYIIALGTNDVMAKCKLPPEQQMLDIQALLSELPVKTSCLWVGPATMTSGDIVNHCGLPAMQGFYQLLQTTLTTNKCSFVDSRNFRAPAGLELPTATDQPPKSLADCTNSANNVLEPNNGFHFAGALAHFWADCVSLQVDAFLKSSTDDTSQSTSSNAN